jgi:hypothetical protein
MLLQDREERQSSGLRARLYNEINANWNRKGLSPERSCLNDDADERDADFKR